MNEEVKAANETAQKEKEKGVPFGKLLAWSLRPGSTGIAMMLLG